MQLIAKKLIAVILPFSFYSSLVAYQSPASPLILIGGGLAGSERSESRLVARRRIELLLQR